MKKELLAMSILAASLTASAQSIPEKIYVNRYKAAQTTDVYTGDSVWRIAMIRRPFAKFDSVRVVLKDGTGYTYLATSIDSITFEKPETLLADELTYYNNVANGKIPTYADNYTTTNVSWVNQKNWNLANVHDPSVMKAADGYYYMYQTDAGYGNPIPAGQHFYARRSKDLITWEGLGCAMTGTPQWCTDSVNAIRARMSLPLLGSTADNAPAFEMFWAPCARKVNDHLYRMYYVIAPSNYIKTGNHATAANFDNSWSERAFIGLMETTDPASNIWTDKGYVICSSTEKGITATDWYRTSISNYSAYFKWNAIDPSYIITPTGEHWLAYGSWHGGECAIQLNPETGKLLNNVGDPWKIGTGTTTTYGKRINTRLASSRWQASEAPEVIYNAATGYYYLFLAYDDVSTAYNTRVCRSTSIDGPYYDMSGTNVSATGGDCYPVVTHPYKFNSSKEIDGWVGFAHCAVWDDGQGNYFYASQARLPENYDGNAYSNAVMMGHVRSIRWTSTGWPVVMPERYAGVPQATISQDELVGTWENIDLSYQYGVQKTSKPLTLNADGTTSGAFISTWSYDAANQRITFTIAGTKTEVCVQRELDWEAAPRKATIVYAGYNSTGHKTYWGKKIS